MARNSPVGRCLYALAKIGAWYDSKLNGRVGIKTLWLSWFILMEMVEFAKLFKSI